MSIKEVKEKYQDQLMALPGVIGVGIGAENNEHVIKVLVIKQTKKLARKIPKKLETYKVVIEETGEIRAL